MEKENLVKKEKLCQYCGEGICENLRSPYFGEWCECSSCCKEREEKGEEVKYVV